MTTAAPSTALVTIQPAFTEAERLALSRRRAEALPAPGAAPGILGNL
jgi:hypothetical protein